MILFMPGEEHCACCLENRLKEARVEQGYQPSRSLFLWSRSDLMVA